MSQKISATVIEDSIAPNGKRLTTMVWVYPRFIHGEVMTHRVFSRNAMSSRAVPVAKMIDQVRNDPVIPIHWGKNQPGMQALEQLTGWALESTQIQWRRAASMAAQVAEMMNENGAHKQLVNRILEPFQWMYTIVSATEWDNFDELRDHDDAEPHMRDLARRAKIAREFSFATLRPRDRMVAEGWHLPFVTPEERMKWANDPVFLAKLSVARCARVSYLTHDGKAPEIEKDLALYDRLVGSRPLHASPCEHQAYPLPLATQNSKNFFGWRQNRELIELDVWASDSAA